MENKIDKFKQHLQELIECDLTHLTECQHNLDVIENNKSFGLLKGCPYKFNLHSQGFCIERGSNDDVCYRCWKTALNK